MNTTMSAFIPTHFLEIEPVERPVAKKGAVYATKCSIGASPSNEALDTVNRKLRRIGKQVLDSDARRANVGSRRCPCRSRYGSHNWGAAVLDSFAPGEVLAPPELC